MVDDKPMVILTGGVGGAKFVDGVSKAVSPSHLTVIGNVGDDVERHGLWVSPDMDIVTYTLAGLVDREKGWGMADDTFRTLEALGQLGETTWMHLGDLDLATHIVRTKLRRAGMRPTDIARHIAERLGVKQRILPPTDEPAQTLFHTDQGWLNFQEYLLREQCRPRLRAVEYRGAPDASATPETLEAIRRAAVIFIAPSNPIASIGPILAVGGLREALAASPAYRVGVSPLVGGRSLKGPSDRIMRACGYAANAEGVARYYGDLLHGIVIDEKDRAAERLLQRAGKEVLVADTVMRDDAGRRRLADTVIHFACEASHA